jgi:nicotinamidase-related amidase
MRRTWMVLFPLLAVGCGGSDAPGDDGNTKPGTAQGAGGGSSSGGGSGAGSPSSSGNGGSGASGGAPGGGTLGVAIIDVQETFVDGSATPDMDGVIARTSSVFQLAGEHALPFLVTYEASQSGDHALHAPLVPSLPAQAEHFTKTTFAATGQPTFATAAQGHAVTHYALLGAETDVCVLQTVLGLREMGLDVLLQTDAVFSEETHTSPALRRMQQAGVRLVTLDDVAGFAAAPETLPAHADQPVRRVRPLEMGVVLNAFGAGADLDGDPLDTHKTARLKELLLVSEWFELPVFVADPGSGLPAELADNYWGTLQPLSAIAGSGVTQLVVAGTDAGIDGALGGWMDGREVFVMEDALLATGAAGAQEAALAPFFEQGLVPTTYKTFWYEMTQSVDPAEWPSPEWTAKIDEYWDITQAPEDLPSIPD